MAYQYIFRPASWIRCFLIYMVLCMVALLSSCANPGNGPDGGPYDETPPRIVKVNPALGATNQKTRKVTLLFNEMIKVEKAQEKVIVSPPQIEVPK